MDNVEKVAKGLSEPSTYQCRAWERRAATIQRKAEDLLGDMIQALSEEHELTDPADNVVDWATDLTEYLARYPDMLKARARQYLQEQANG